MNAIRDFVRRLLRGPRASAFLGRLGIDSRRFWLLMDLFDQLSERGEMMDQLGRNGVALQFITWMFAIITGLMSVLLVLRQASVETYLSLFLAVTAFLLMATLLSEAGNSLVNPVEGLVLAHQPINGATYTAAKLMHLARIVLYLVPAINAIPAAAGLMLKGAPWFYPVVHLAIALTVGVVAGLLCCALYRWLIRLVPVGRLKAAGQLAGTVPFFSVMWLEPARKLVARAGNLVPSRPVARWELAIAVGAGVFAIAVLGIRSLSADYLIRVSGIMHARRPKGARFRKSRTGRIVGSLFGGPPARAGFAYVCQTARRDYQFRRQMLPLVVFAGFGWIPTVATGWRTDPFSGHFTTAHLVPHIFGLLLFFLCIGLTYGSDYKAAWVFQLAPARAFGGFARGVYAALWVPAVVVPHLILLVLLPWSWGPWHALLFVVYSAATASLYLALELRAIDGVPFSKQTDAKRGAAMLPMMLAGGAVMAIAVGVQYWFVFRTPAIAIAVTAIISAAAYVLTRSSLRALEGTFRRNLSLLSGEFGGLYKEI